MGYKLQNGDQINVETNRARKPSDDWLKWVVTSKARERIRQSLREEEKFRADLGKEALQRKLDKLKIEFEPSLDIIMKHFSFRMRHEFYLAVYNEAIDLQEDLKVFSIEKGKLMPVEEEREVKQAPLSKDDKKGSKDKFKPQLFIEGLPSGQFEYEFADCCKPVQGDDVFAYITSNNLYKIHRTICLNAPNLMAHYGYRVRKAEWGAASNTNFVAELLITGVDTGVGVIERLSTRLSEMDLNIRAFNIEGNEGYFECHVKLMVTNKDQLTLAIRALKTLEGVANVVRVEN